MTGEVTCPDDTASTARIQVTEVCKCVKRLRNMYTVATAVITLKRGRVMDVFACL